MLAVFVVLVVLALLVLLLVVSCDRIAAKLPVAKEVKVARIECCSLLV